MRRSWARWLTFVLVALIVAGVVIMEIGGVLAAANNPKTTDAGIVAVVGLITAFDAFIALVALNIQCS